MSQRLHIEDLNRAIWRVGVRLVHRAKQLNIMQRGVEQALEWLGSCFIPPSDSEVTARLEHGLLLTLPGRFPPARAYSAGVYEEEVTKVFKQIVHEGMTVVDLGAFCGYYTLLASRLVGSTGHVYAVEADPKNFSYLLRNLHANNCTNVTAMQAAILHSIGRATLVTHKKADHHWISPEPLGDHHSIEIPKTTLDEAISQEGWPPVQLIKIDIEGAEQAALEGMRELSRRNPNLLLIMEFDESNLKRAGASRDSISKILHDLGFISGSVIERSMMPFPLKSGIPRLSDTYNLLLSKS